MIELKNIKLNIQNIDILNDISFNIEDNSVTCILGNKNSGKSSLLKLMANIHRDYYGEVLYDGKDINELKEINIDMIHETREKDQDISVIEYLQFYGSIYNKFSDEELNKFIDEMLKKFSLMSYKYTALSILDNENYKLVDFIRVLINNPKVILFDNLFSSDNTDFNERLLELVKTFVGKKTLVFTARSLNYIEGITTHIGIIDAGSLIAYGKKEDVYKQAELSNRIEIEVLSGLQEAVELLKDNEKIANIIYDDSKISFSMISDLAYRRERSKLEGDILKQLIDNDIKVYSFKRQRVRFEQLFGRIKN